MKQPTATGTTIRNSSSNRLRRRTRCCLAAAAYPLAAVAILPGETAMALSAFTSSVATRAAASSPPAKRTLASRVVSIPESQWRQSAAQHSARIRDLLAPGLTSLDHPLNSGRRRQLRNSTRPSHSKKKAASSSEPEWTALDPKNPVYNFLIEYYGLKGSKGPRRLARWSPDFSVLAYSNDQLAASGLCSEVRPIDSVGGNNNIAGPQGGILLVGATEDDFLGTLHLKGAMPLEDGVGIVYSPSLFYNRYADQGGHDENVAEERRTKMKAAGPFQWYRSILSNTLDSEPIFHCHGLHEWAMQYHPEGADPPPSGKYQSHMPLRVSREVINATVERRGIHCTHVDALRFFAPSAAPLNHHGAQLEREDQLRLEQRGCVHAHMDLLKISMRLQPFVDASLVADTLETALIARHLDVEASPYDVKTTYGLDTVAVETPEGREEYRRRQKELMKLASPVRKRLLAAYDAFLELAFDEDILTCADRNPAPERFARAEPGGAPWRKNLIAHSS
mmetsp:Transcript_11875/g.25701  ORF Transcript_11875/g.25701 Transcript_11875/m.25701 type:complete len:507 (+) Transcript_11875:59-1579(+)